jgi:hypothetical protein
LDKPLFFLGSLTICIIESKLLFSSGLIKEKIFMKAVFSLASKTATSVIFVHEVSYSRVVIHEYFLFILAVPFSIYFS